MCSGVGDWTCLQPGFPIRTSSDHSSVANSPRLIAGSYVLHRLLVPRHPPCALTNLATKFQRCSRPLCSSQATGGNRPQARRLPPLWGWFVRGEGPRLVHRTGRPEVRVHARSLRTQQRAEAAPSASSAFQTGVPGRTGARHSCDGQLVDVPPMSNHLGTRARVVALDARPAREPARQMLLRKEVIQPHLPVRLPCYDFVPIASPTFDGSLP